MEIPKNAINWFEIPTSQFDRAKTFYSTIFAFEMPETEMGPNRMGFFLHQQGVGIGGAIVSGEGYEPSSNGALVYFNGGNDLTTVLERIEPAGGHVVLGKTQITPELGYFAIFLDSEGNRVALHSMN